MHLDVGAHRLQQAGREQIDLLFLGDVFAVGQELEELVDVLVDRSGAATMRELAERIAAQKRPETLLDAVYERFPLQNAMILLLAVLPLAGRALQVERGRPNLLILRCAVSSEELFSLVDPSDGVF